MIIYYTEKYLINILKIKNHENHKAIFMIFKHFI